MVFPATSHKPPRHRQRRSSRPGAGLPAVAVLAAFGVAGGAAFSGSGTVHAAAATASTRIAGADRFATAAAVSQAAFPNGASIVYLATGTDYPDALAAAAAAGGHGPVLLTLPTTLSAPAASELTRVHPATVVVVGGAAAISDGVVSAVRAAVPGATLTRVSGVDRYATAAALSQRTFPHGSSLAWLATGLDFPDALSAAAASGGKAPVLLVKGSTVPASTMAELKRLGVTKIHVVGGTSTIPSVAKAAVESALPAVNADRVWGADRFATAAAVSSIVFATGVPDAYVATGEDFPDALSAAAAAAGKGPVLLVGDGALPASTSTELKRLAPGQLTVVGGTAAITTNLETQLRQVVAAAAAPPVSGKAALAVATAEAQLGKPYVWAGAGPDNFDCSGLTAYAWAAAGVLLPHNSQAQYGLLPPVAIPDLQPGDLVFYGTPTDVYHVGIYIGGGQMIEAAHTGTNVRIANIQRSDLLSGGRPS